jgi:hypothetical protein
VSRLRRCIYVFTKLSVQHYICNCHNHVDLIQVLLDAAAANFRKQEYYRLSLELLHGYPPAAKLLGEPIVARRVELGDPEKTRTDSLNARVISHYFTFIIYILLTC